MRHVIVLPHGYAHRVRRNQPHPFADRWNHNTHYFPLLASRLPEGTARALDVGCGDGTWCRYLAGRGTDVLGLDADAGALPARSSAPRDQASGVGYVVGSAEALPFADGTFDAVTMSMVLHHVDPPRALAEAARVLSPGGVLLVLGYGRLGSWRDLPHEVVDAVAHRVHARGKRSWEPPTSKADPNRTWSQAREDAARTLPGSTYRRLPMWRYLVEWTKER